LTWAPRPAKFEPRSAAIWAADYFEAALATEADIFG
jgi:hypothetical protein